MSAISSRSRSKRAGSDRSLLYLFAGFTVLVVLAIVALSVISNQPRTDVPPAAAAVLEAELLPLAEPIDPIYGFHDMPNIPQSMPQGRTVPTGTPQPNVDLPLMRWDWGTIPARPPVSQTFPIQNKGDEPLLVSKVVTSCGCTVANLTSSVIPAGQRADLVVTFDPAYHETSGPVTRIVWVETNDPDTPLFELRLDANVLP
jgi:hypothetical protein